MPARAEVPTFTQGLRFDLPTTWTALRWLDFLRWCSHVQRTSLFRFVRRHFQKLCRARIENLSIKSGLLRYVFPGPFNRALGRARHVGDLQLLGCDQTEALHQGRADLMVKVQTPPRILGLDSCRPDCRFASAFGAAFAPVADALKLKLASFGLLIPSRIFNRLVAAIRQRQHGEGVNAPIEAARFSAAFALDGLAFDCQR